MCIFSYQYENDEKMHEKMKKEKSMKKLKTIRREYQLLSPFSINIIGYY